MKQEVRRGRKFIEYHDPDTQDEFTFTQEISGADVSYQETDGSWHPSDENWATDGVDGFVLKNDKLNHKIRLKGNGGRTWYPRRNVATEYLTFGIPQYRNGTKWSNFRFSGWSVEGKTITLQTRQNVTILVHSKWNGIKIDWVLANASAPKRMRYPVSLTGITEIAGVLFGADGVELGRLTPTTATDANEAELPCSGSYAGGYVEFQADVTGAVYPIKIDPDFSGSTDSAYVWGSNSDRPTAMSTASGVNVPSGATVLLVGGKGYGTPTYNVWRSFLKFDTSTIEDGATITQVNIKMVATTKGWWNRNIDIKIIKCDWSETDPITTDNMDTAFDNCDTATPDDNIWMNTSGVTLNTQYTSGNLSTAWVSKTGNTYYGLRSNRDDGVFPGTGEDEYAILASPNHETSNYRPVLTVTYTAAATGTLRRTNMNAQMSNLTGGMHG